MDKETAIKLFEDKRVRVLWDEDLEKWFFSIIDVVGVLSESDNPRKYWSVLKTRLKAEGSQLAGRRGRAAVSGPPRRQPDDDRRHQPLL